MTSHPLFSRLYSRMAPGLEQVGAGAHRDEMLSGLRGRVIEVGAGSGLCFGHYPSTVTEVVALEPEPYLRGLAQKAAPAAPVPVRVIDGSADHLPAEDGSFDAAVTSLVLCSVPDQIRALTEAHRVLRPGGELRFYEHVRSDDPRQAKLQERTAWIWPHLFGGCHTDRQTESAMVEAGFRIERCRRFDFETRITSRPTIPHIVGTAVRP
ncbi:MAG: class I SAM-dependent methyltransferase [Acidimicrobiales bacterium]|jgi:ubiquinone/menaquinone biosynthesis C-methylase UbiE